MTWAPWGLADPAAIEEAVGEVRRRILQGAADPRVINFARSLAEFPADSSPLGIARFMRTWLDRHWRFVDDPPGDYFRPVLDSLRQYERAGVIVGDCDDAAIVAGALCVALHLHVVLDVLSFDADPRLWRHIYAVALTDGGAEVDFDVTKPVSGSVSPTAYIARFPV